LAQVERNPFPAVIEGGGHTWPGGPQYLPAFLIGKASHSLDATQAIWDFFKRHSR
jgi:polyhydroxybutyrate depolymerase